MNSGLPVAAGDDIAKALTGVLAGGVGYAAGGTAGAVRGVNEDFNNRQLHLSELEWIKRNAKRFAQQASSFVGRPVSEDEAAYFLSAAGEYNVADPNTQRSISNFVRDEDRFVYDEAKKYLLTHANDKFTHSRGVTQTMFSANAADRANAALYADQRNNASYRDMMWLQRGVNLRGDAMSLQEAAIYEVRRQALNAATGKSLALAAGLAVIPGGWRLARSKINYAASTRAEQQIKAAANSGNVADEIAALERIGKNPNGSNPVGRKENSVLYQQAEKISTAKPWQSTVPRDLNEQILWNKVIENPKIGNPLPLGLDPRFPKDAGFQKMQANHQLPDGGNITIHYQYNSTTGKAYDVKIVTPRQTPPVLQPGPSIKN